jgi:FlgN protein.
MSAAERLSALDSLPAAELCANAGEALAALVDIMNRETTLLRAGHLRDSAALTPEKTRLAQDYVGFARSIQRQAERLKAEAPAELEALRQGHEQLATQMAENLRVIATAKAVTDDLLTDVAMMVGQQDKAMTYGANGTIGADPADSALGIAINKAR